MNQKSNMGKVACVLSTPNALVDIHFMDIPLLYHSSNCSKSFSPSTQENAVYWAFDSPVESDGDSSGVAMDNEGDCGVWL